MSETRDGAFTHVRGELAWTIAEHRSATEAILMVKHLTRADEGQFELLGLRDGCETAVFWDHIWRGVIEVGFDAHGVEDLDAAKTQSTGDFGKGEYLENSELADWDLVHPRHQWLVE